MLYDPYSRRMQEDPYPVYRHFRDEEPCHYNSEKDFYALFRFEDVWQATAGQPLPEHVLSAVNLEYTPSDTIVAEGDEIAFFPPVTGG